MINYKLYNSNGDRDEWWDSVTQQAIKQVYIQVMGLKVYTGIYTGNGPKGIYRYIIQRMGGSLFSDYSEQSCDDEINETRIKIVSIPLQYHSRKKNKLTMLVTPWQVRVGGHFNKTNTGLLTDDRACCEQLNWTRTLPSERITTYYSSLLISLEQRHFLPF